MYKIVGDIEPRSFWLVGTPSASPLKMPYVCTEAGALYGKQKFLTERDNKDSYLLLYTIAGEGFVRQNNRTVTIKHGQMLLMDCRTPQAYGTAPQADHWHHLWAHIEGVGVEVTAQRLGLPKLAPIAVSRSRTQPHFDTIFERLEQEGVEHNEIVGMAVHSLLSGMLIAQLRMGTPVDSPVVLARNYVAVHYAEPLTVEVLAREAAVSQSYLTRLFREQLGVSPHEYLINHRIDKAKQLLRETDLPVGTVARQVGFTSESNFSYRFSKVCEISPRAYRNLGRNAS